MSSKKQDEIEMQAPPLLDLLEITRGFDALRTEVRIQVGKPWENRTEPWILFGQARLFAIDNPRRGEWQLNAYLPTGVTDFEHDSGYALKLPLVGVQFTGVLYHFAQFTAWVCPTDPADFRVPNPGYNPMKHPEAYTCREGVCQRAPHIIVPQGMYVPPSNEELWTLVRGRRVEITVGPNQDKS